MPHYNYLFGHKKTHDLHFYKYEFLYLVLYFEKKEAKDFCDAKGSQFDSSLERGMPFQLALGQGMVIKGWEEGLIGI